MKLQTTTTETSKTNVIDALMPECESERTVLRKVIQQAITKAHSGNLPEFMGHTPEGIDTPTEAGFFSLHNIYWEGMDASVTSAVDSDENPCFFRGIVGVFLPWSPAPEQIKYAYAHQAVIEVAIRYWVSSSLRVHWEIAPSPLTHGRTETGALDSPNSRFPGITWRNGNKVESEILFDFPPLALA